MKTFFVVSAVITAAALVSCQKQQTEAEKNAEVERRVQERLAAEHQAQQQRQLDQRQADLDAREKALAEKENIVATPANRATRSESESIESRQPPREPRERAITTGYSTFYNKLEPYGAWLETSDYGYVWQPRQVEVSHNWRPYTNGRWVYTDAGWTWISEEPFGWATYHYGRWTRLRGIGWVWVPGNQWAPAWVSWRKSNDYVGWAPLPPEARFDQRTGIHNWSDSYYDIGPDQYCFVASREFGAPRIEQTLLPPERNGTIVNQTTNVTNITYNNTTIVNEGPNYDELRAISREPVQRYRLERRLNIDLAAEPPRAEMRGETVVIAAPLIAAPVANERPPTVKQTIAAAAVDLGWAAIVNQDEAKKLREKMKSEAAPPPNAPLEKSVKTAAATSTPTQRSEAAATSKTATATPSAVATTTPVAGVTPVTTASAIRIVVPSASGAPTASHRRGRLLVPNTTPSPPTPPSATPRPKAADSPVVSDTVPSTEITPLPQASALVPTGSPQGELARGHFKSQAQRFQPRKVEPMPSASPSPRATSATLVPAAAIASTTPGGNLTKQEKKEQKLEEKNGMKRERKEGFEARSPLPSPQSSP